MTMYHRFHFKIDQYLLSVLKWRGAYFGLDQSVVINQILKKMMVVINEIDLFPSDFILDDCETDFSENIIVKLEVEFYNKLRYLHYRFGTFSIACLLRRFLRLYLIRFRNTIIEILEIFKKYSEGRVWVCSNIQTHMLDAVNKISRILIITDNNVIQTIYGFP
ncbi:MAG: hypothetical protein A2015_13425 [Spirochaetes bacterium GWF1_31_7]|nr:MAG: hypothetical protein A2Y30_11400 [Spirochaetes bacterium GWE1_32_154]OHD49823.1 MAG: hypothetical protein A2015_13425 [Spirochaetes bacterium GWF1_31_7]OHD52786.1 MAG: hypothetical protein A2Y29_15670 [Spirochaetes bacterium GWE2_31_10]OHD82555.1 MAG: hypothetical protein A2355_12770 [Spirochaetes bacterium RIFOXYB1_FULL_32_8]HBD92932.1 hypothetical protein [Spirochaetia bacterium]